MEADSPADSPSESRQSPPAPGAPVVDVESRCAPGRAAAMALTANASELDSPRRSAQLYLGRALATVVAASERRRSEYKVARAARVPVAWGPSLTWTVDSRLTVRNLRPWTVLNLDYKASRGGFRTCRQVASGLPAPASEDQLRRDICWS